MSAAGSGVRRRGVGVAVVVAVLVGLAVVVTGPPAVTTPLDPEGTGPSGLRGLVELLRGAGVEVEVGIDALDGPAQPGTTRVFVPQDVIGDEARERLRGWTAQGGVLVVAGAGSELHGLVGGTPPLADTFGVTTREPACALAGLDQVDAVTHGGWVPLVAPEAPPGEGPSVVCFPDPDAPKGDGDLSGWLVARELEAGALVALGSATPFTNAELDRDDNAVLAAALLGAAPGDRLVIVPRPAVGEGDTPVLELVPDGFFRGLALLSVAVLLLVVWRARRLGPPVAERLPPVLPSAETARSVAGLLQRAGARGAAAERLRDDARATAIRALGLPTSIPPDELTGLVVARTAVSPQIVGRALIHGDVDDDTELEAVAAACAQLRDALRHPRPRGTKP